MYANNIICLAPVSSLYLFSIRQCNTDLTHTIGKYGFTKDLHRRAREHAKTFGPRTRLQIHQRIDPLYLRDAENDVRTFFKRNGFCINYKSIMELDLPVGKELVIIPCTEMKSVMDEYERIGNVYLKPCQM